MPSDDVLIKDSQRTSQKLSLVDLFSGPGGLSLGFKMSGFFEPIIGVESKHEAATTYRNNFNTEVFEKNVEDISSEQLSNTVIKKGYQKIDAIVGGPPCRPFTTANRGSTRWEKVLEKNGKINDEFEQPNWLSFWKIIDALEPKPLFVVAENVMGMRNHEEVFLKFLERLGRYYSTTVRELHANCFGVPQRRKRIFIAGIRDFQGESDKILPMNPPLDSIKPINVGEAISDLPELSNDNPGFQISNYKKGRPNSYQSILRKNCSKLFDHVVHSVHPTMAERFNYIPSGYSLKKAWYEGKIPEAIMKSKYFNNGRIRQFSQKTITNMHSNIYRRLDSESLSCTITHVRKTVLIHPIQNRLISVREAARLQSFPDWFRFSGSISQQYQQIADAVPPFLAKAIASHLGKLYFTKE